MCGARCSVLHNRYSHCCRSVQQALTSSTVRKVTDEIASPSSSHTHFQCFHNDWRYRLFLVNPHKKMRVPFNSEVLVDEMRMRESAVTATEIENVRNVAGVYVRVSREVMLYCSCAIITVKILHSHRCSQWNVLNETERYFSIFISLVSLELSVCRAPSLVFHFFCDLSMNRFFPSPLWWVINWRIYINCEILRLLLCEWGREREKDRRWVNKWDREQSARQQVLCEHGWRIITLFSVHSSGETGNAWGRVQQKRGIKVKNEWLRKYIFNIVPSLLLIGE